MKHHRVHKLQKLNRIDTTADPEEEDEDLVVSSKLLVYTEWKKAYPCTTSSTSRWHFINVNGNEVKYRAEGHLTIRFLASIIGHRGRD